MNFAFLKSLIVTSLAIYAATSYGDDFSERKFFTESDELNCIAHSRDSDSLQAACDSIIMEQAIDEGYRVFSSESSDYSSGCLVLERNSGDKLEFIAAEDRPYPCLEADDYGFLVLGSF